jgi:pyruvate kinase
VGLKQGGMDVARINCAHDDAEVWGQMIAHLRSQGAGEELSPKVAMDLAGPKIRTGPMSPGPKVRRFKPVRDIYGKVVQPARVWLGPLPPAQSEIPHLPIASSYLELLKSCKKLNFRDTRGKMRALKITEVFAEGVVAESRKTFYVQTGLPLLPQSRELSLPILVGELPAVEQGILLKEGDQLWLTSGQVPGRGPQVNERGELLAPAQVSCTAPQIFASVQVGEPISLDDGKFGGVIERQSEEGLLVSIQQVKGGGATLRADKGINFPQSQLRINGLTEKDCQDLDVVVKAADLVNVSFVNSAQDVTEFLTALETYERTDPLGVVLKIETQSGFNQLPEILLTGMQTYPLGVMIARGDLAVEAGWENMARVQEEMLAICHAAHIPVIWATQVLENLAKKGIPSRAEITDAGMAQRAECVMLNKGPAILPALKLLDSILKDRASYMEKGQPMLPALERASPVDKTP